MRRLPTFITVSAVIVLTIGGCLTVGTLVFGSSVYRLNDDCKVDGYVGQFEATLLQGRFWRAQESMIDAKIATLRDVPQQIADERARLNGIDRDSAQFVAQICKEADIDCKPSSPEVQAMRAQAKALQDRANDVARFQAARAEFTALQSCKATVHERATR